MSKKPKTPSRDRRPAGAPARAPEPSRSPAAGCAVAVAAPPPRDPWLTGPVTDLLVGAGLWSLPLLAFTSWAGAPGAGGGPGGAGALLPMAFLFYALSVFCNNPHYFATLHRAYGTAEDRAKYRLFTVHATAVLAATALAALAAPALLPVLFTVYVTWSPWHYTGQNFGVAMLFARRAGVAPTPRERNLTYGAYLATYLIWTLSAHRAGADAGPYMISLGVPDAAAAWLRAALMAGAAAALGAAMIPMVARHGWRAMLGPAAIASTQSLWFVAPSILELGFGAAQPPVYFATGALAFMHCAQYLWVTAYFARRKAIDAAAAAGLPPPAAERAWRPWHYYGAMVIGGLALFVPAPWVVSRLAGRDFVECFLIFTAIVNIHHFVIDGAVWKLRDGRIARVLLGDRAAAGAAATAVPVTGRTPAVRSPMRRFALPAAAAGVVVLGGVDLVQYWNTSESASRAGVAMAAALNPYDTRVQVRQARALLNTGATTGAIALLRRAVDLNPRSEATYLLGTLLVGTGDLDSAREHYRRQETLVRPDITTWLNTGVMAARDGRPQEAVTRLKRAAAAAPDRPDAWLNLAEACRTAGDPAAALPAYDRWLALKKTSGALSADAPPEARAEVAEVARRIGDSYTALGRDDLAKSSYENARTLGGL